MALQTVDLPAPAEMRSRWAAYAALLAVRGERWAQGAHATPDGWHYDDGGGNWVDVVLVGADRAVLVGHDHEYSETYFREGATYFGESETDLLGGAPPWWEPAIASHLERQRTDGMWIGFVYGFDGRWTRSGYDLADGFTSVGLPFTDDQKTVDALDDLLANWFVELRLPPPADIRARVREIIEPGAEVTAAVLQRILGPAGAHADIPGAVAAAQRF
ncbi:hypothetical protein MHN80_19670 [Gordonia McavH-238-E]|uniref:Proteophosphoglycan 5 n=1 Tax=Gordonia terrae TaxID=2055 RepID=A0A2I1R1X4_9ACTN|nr:MULTISPECIES: hypothetical protein [Gordonia]MCG7634536.1 hypothetical protein [Gordonia sp. McavH-238-E]PKZ63101.1 hypothetical protein CYJ73_23635 [Gordonia terrae]